MQMESPVKFLYLQKNIDKINDKTFKTEFSLCSCKAKIVMHNPQLLA